MVKKSGLTEPVITVIRNGNDLREEYLPANRKWQAISTIEVTGKRIWASWMSGGVTEPDPNNYIVVGFSDDDGDTWIDPFMIIDTDLETSRGRDPVLWLDNFGVLWLFYGFNETYALKITNPEAALPEIRISKPAVVFDYGMMLNKPIVTEKGEWLCMFDPFDKDSGYSYNCCYYSDDFGASWKKRGVMPSATNGKLYQEGTVIEKRNGELWALTRIELASCGGIEESFSHDGGYTWSVARSGLGFPFVGPGSKMYMRRLKSGNLLFLNNNTDTKERINMSAYLSEDDGATWKSLLLDGREKCAYPDAAEDEYGNIYVIFDCGRRDRNEIRICKFTEDDIKRGEFFRKGNYKMKAVSKNPAYADIVSYKKVTKTRITVTAENRCEYSVCGKWQKRKINGENYRWFNCDEDLEKNLLTDAKGILLEKENKE